MNDTMILNEFPSTDDFYKTYWGKKPFIVRGAIDQDLFDDLIDGDSLAGLSLEEDIKSRLVITEPENNKWICHHGPFPEDKFSTLGDSNWNLLVQNVEQYHPETAQLLSAFNFSPRWLMDDIMVSYSATGGSVGPHTDSYHVFLVQGMGKRKWKIGHSPIENQEYIDDTDLLVLKHGFEGYETEVSIGDVIYIPPHFGHQGITTQEAMTFSVGFLGPQRSELFAEYSHYLEQHPHINKRYTGQGLDANSAAFSIAPSATNIIQNDLIEAIKDERFSTWMAEYFSIPTHDSFQNATAETNHISSANLLETLQSGEVLCRPEHIKLAITRSVDGSTNIAGYSGTLMVPAKHEKLIHWLNNNHKISIDDLDNKELITLVTHLYNNGILSFNDI